jgi:gliding motility-associated-like protein
VTRGLPNTCLASATANSDFWRSLRQPTWINPVLTGNVNAANDLVTLNWNPTAVDPFPADSVTGYLILRNTSNTFGAPLDGHTYTIGNNIGGASVIALITGSQKVTYPDAVTVPCPSGFYYRIYSYRYGTDNINGNDYNMARGRAYNENVFGEVHVTGPGPVTPVSAVSDRDSLCINDAGNITLSATGGSGVTLNWFTGSCGGTLIGAGTGANNSITIPSPTATTTYYARWESTCGVSSCASVTVTVLADFPVSVFITASINPVCISTPVIFTASPVNPGPAPAYQWKVNGVNAGTNSNTYSYTPANGDNVSVVLTSDAACPSGNPATSNTIVMSVSSAVPVSAGISAAPGDSVCTGTTVTYTATPVNGGANPSYQWFLNGTSVGGNNPAWSNIPVNGDTIYCKVTSSLTCASNNPATSDTVIIAIIPSLPVSVNIAAVPSDTVCTGTTITYTATPVNGGTNPSYQWFLNGNPAGGNSPVWSTVPSNGDVIYCQVTSDYSCATNNPASSNTINVTVSSGMPVSVSITAAPNDTICSGTAVTFTATLVNGGPTPVFQWYLNGIPAGADNAVYTVTPADGDVVYCSVTSSLSCAISNPANSNSIKITHSTALTVTITISANHTGICPGTVITFTAVPSNEGTSPVYDWLVNGVSVQTGNSPVFTTNSLAGGESVVCRLTSSLSCLVANPVSSAPISIPRAPAPVVKLTDKPYLCVADAPRLDAGAGFTTYLWQDGSTGRYITATKPDVYRVTVTDSLGCTASDSALVKVCETLVFVPDAFTPNGDGLNDEFKAITSQEGITEFSMRIFNRWGELIFESTDVHIGWNGMVKGQVASPGTYVWKIVYQVSSQGSPSGSSTTLQGTVTLVR